MAYQYKGGRRCGRERQLHEADRDRRRPIHQLAVSNGNENRREAGETLYVAHSSVASTPRPVLIVTSAGRNYVLRSWPEGYHLYCHYKGKQSSPRQDLYLLGMPLALPLLFCSDVIIPNTPPRGIQGRFTRNGSARFPSLCLTQYGL